VSVVKFFLEGFLDERMQAARDRKREFIARALDGEELAEHPDTSPNSAWQAVPSLS
jgi:hypothetical protein